VTRKAGYAHRQGSRHDQQDRIKRRANGSQALFDLAALVIVGSMVAHSSTDVPVAKWFASRATEATPGSGG
jgi:hypothetical protein